MPPKAVLSPKAAPRGAPATRRYRRPLNEDAYSVDKVRERHAERKGKPLQPSGKKAEDKYSSHAVRSRVEGSKDHTALPKTNAVRESEMPTGAAAAAAPVPEPEAVRRLLPLMQRAAHEFAARLSLANHQSEDQLWRDFLSWAAVRSGVHPTPAPAPAPAPAPEPEPKPAPQAAPSSSSNDAAVAKVRISPAESGDGCSLNLTIGGREATRKEEYAATSIQTRWRWHQLRHCLPDLLKLLRTIPSTDPTKLEPLRRRIKGEGGDDDLSPGVLTVTWGKPKAAGMLPGSLRGATMRAVPSFGSFEAYAEAVAGFHRGEAPAALEPTDLDSTDEAGAWQLLGALVAQRPCVGVMGGYFPQEPMRVYYALGEQLARAGFSLVTGGGGSMAGGPVTSLLAGFTSVADRPGRTIGIVPDENCATGVVEGVSPLNDTLVRTNLPAAHTRANTRNHLNVLLVDAVVALAGGPGTLHEIELAVEYGRALAASDYWRTVAAVPDAADAMPADAAARWGFLAMPKFWEPDGGGGTGVRLTAAGRAMRDETGTFLGRPGVTAEERCCWRTAEEAMPFIVEAVDRARNAKRDWQVVIAQAK